MEIRFGNEIYDLELNGLRKLLHDAVSESIYELSSTCGDDRYEEEESEIHELISSQDIDGLLNGFFCNGEINFYEVEHDDILIEALQLAGYDVTKSNVSRSLYAINDNGEEVRIADHNRPAIVQNGVCVGEHDYQNQIIVKGNVVRLNELKGNGFSKLTKSEYILG